MDHGPNGEDDCSNAAAGAMVLAISRQPMICEKRTFVRHAAVGLRAVAPALVLSAGRTRRVGVCDVSFAVGDFFELGSPLPICRRSFRAKLAFPFKCTGYSEQQLLLKIVRDNLQSNR